uniref:Uncharacterized protein n=1 Tax=Anguilla anguilla TaxID=7936 RepID=A0A0E9RKY3_ANGAN
MRAKKLAPWHSAMQISMSSQLIRRRRLHVAICWQPTDFTTWQTKTTVYQHRTVRKRYKNNCINKLLISALFIGQNSWLKYHTVHGCLNQQPIRKVVFFFWFIDKNSTYASLDELWVCHA